MRKERPSESIRRAYQHLGQAFNAAKVSLTLPQTSALRVLMQDGPQKQRSLCHLTGTDRATMSTLLARMATAGLVVAVREERDMRITMISITPTGREALLKADSALVLAEKRMMRLIRIADRPAFLRGLRAISESL